MYRGRLWTMRQYAGFGNAEESNRRYRSLLDQGAMGLSVAFDLPTQLGLDPDHPRSKGEVGKVGVSISTIDEMKTLFQGIDLSKVSTSMTINATAPILLALYAATAEESGAKLSEIRGTIQNDVLKEYLARGNYIYPAIPSLRLTTDLFDWCMRFAPKWNPISISGYHIREAGSNAVQELGFTFGNAIEYVKAAVARGLHVDQFAGQLSFFFNVHSDFFEEIAKFRAARKLWSRILTERFGAKDPRSLMLRFHSQTAGSTLTAQQPMNNVVRVAYQAMAAVLGGTQSLHTNGMDEALSLPTEESARLALRTQQVLAHETGVTSVVDPLGGSFFIEHLTTELENRAWELLAEIDRRGGMVKCIESGWAQGEILQSAYTDQKKIDAKALKVVGVNSFEEGSGAAKASILKIAAGLEAKSVEKIRAFRSSRSNAAVEEALRQLEEGAKGDANLQELLQAAMKARATLGEASDRLRKVFGEYRENVG
jgi:methylmalonyl-CoA mutase N-terminal domain/subunit